MQRYEQSHHLNKGVDMKTHTTQSAYRLLRPFLTTVCQYVVFAFVFTAYLLYIPWPPVLWFLMLVPYFLIPILSAYGCCFLLNRGNFHFNARNSAPRASKGRLASRLLSVFCILLLGYKISMIRMMPDVVYKILGVFGENSHLVAMFISNFLLYLIIAIFPIVFALVEFLFVPDQNISTGTQ